MKTSKEIKKLADERGVAMITVVIMSAVLLIVGAGMYRLAISEQVMTHADKAGGEAFYFAEGGIENAIDILNYAGTETQLTKLRADDSADGSGYLMDPDPSSRQYPSNPLQMKIGDESFRVWADLVDENGEHCTNCGLDVRYDEPAYVLLTAEGQSQEGYRKLQQLVRLEPTTYPLTLYIDGDVLNNGTPIVTNQSMYVEGSVYGRNKIEVDGVDLVTGEPAGVFATGTIYAKSNGPGSEIYEEDGSRSSDWRDAYRYDRDSRGPSGDEFTLEELLTYPGVARLSDAQIATLKSRAQATGYYEMASDRLTLQQRDLPDRDGDIVVYIEFPDGVPNDNEVNIKFTWPETGYDGKALIIIENGSAKLTGSAIGSIEGVVYCPDGMVIADGSGNGDFTGFVWSKGLTNIGNFPFYMSEEFMDDPPFFSWKVIREASWTEIDR